MLPGRTRNNCPVEIFTTVERGLGKISRYNSVIAHLPLHWDPLPIDKLAVRSSNQEHRIRTPDFPDYCAEVSLSSRQTLRGETLTALEDVHGG